MESASPTRRARFGAFEADLRSGELHKHGIRLKLQDQPFQVLALLLAHPGEVVTREELRQKLWPADTFVDFDTGLNSAIKKLRDVLGDSAEKPRYIETLPRRGYRFIARVENGAQPASPVSDLGELGQTSRAEEPLSKETQTTQSALARAATGRRRAILIGFSAIIAFVLLVLGLNLVNGATGCWAGPWLARLPPSPYCPWKTSQVIRSRNTLWMA
jgi:DNA-binding winged helix-turn-helix (wHTH) protein